jgi:hypothetical protein
VAVTRILDCLNPALFEVLGRERHRTPLPFVPTLPTGLVSDAADDVMARLAGSDFVCLVSRGPQTWPFDREMAAMLPEMRQWCDQNLGHDGDLEAPDFSVSIYERPALARPQAGRGVTLSAMISSARRGLPFALPPVPGAPILTVPATLFWTTRAEFRYGVRAAYSPVRFRVDGLPTGLHLDPLTGEIRGTFRSTGRFGAVVTAENPRGSARAELTFMVSDQTWDVAISPPAGASIGVPADIGYSAYDSRGTLDFIDVSDLTTGKFIERVAANEDQRRNWQETFRVTFRELGEHRIKLRFVRYDPSGGGKYSFIDRDCVIETGP